MLSSLGKCIRLTCLKAEPLTFSASVGKNTFTTGEIKSGSKVFRLFLPKIKLETVPTIKTVTTAMGVIQWYDSLNKGKTLSSFGKT